MVPGIKKELVSDGGIVSSLRANLNKIGGIRYHHVIVHTNTEDLDYLAVLLKTGQIRPIVQKELKFTTEGIRMGHQLLEDGHVVGKLVMVVNENLH